jgi:hypothetical protein
LREKGEVAAQKRIIKHHPLFVFKNEPLRRIGLISYEHEFIIHTGASEMFDIGASQGIAADDSVLWRARPATLNGQCPNTPAKDQLAPDHCGRPTPKAMFLVALDLDSAIDSIRVRRQSRESAIQPIDSGASQQVIAPAQIHIAGNVCPACPMSPARRLSQRYFPCFFEFVHRHD